ncbi:MAG: phosphate/phosphite/phosphonate ABC transporter substrate-binding protein [Chloroflexia bacterium]
MSEIPPLPTPTGTSESRPLRVAIAAVISPQSTVEEYLPFLDYLGRRLGRPVELLQRRTYAEVNALVRDREVDLALVCTGAYIRGHRDFGMELLAVPQVQGETVYYSYIIVPAASPAHTLADLRGKSFAFTDPLSNSGRLMALYMLRQMGEEPGLFFGRTIYTYSHDNSIRAVADGLVDGAAVDSLVYTYLLSRHPELASRVRVIARSEPCAMPPVVVHPELAAEQKALLQNILLTMHQDEEGRAALARLGIDRFVVLDDRAYDSVRRALEQVEQVP